MNFSKKDFILITVLVLFSASLFLTGLGQMPLTDPDEVFYAETSKEMLNRGELLTQYIFDKPQFEKPPLYYWLCVFSFKAFGVNEFSARFPSAILGILGVLGIYLLAKLFFNVRVALLSGVILATSIFYISLARACVTDMLLCVLILYAFLFFFYGYYSETKKKKWYILAFIFLGLSVIAKGPIGVFLPVLILGLYLIFTKDLKRFKEFPLCSGLLAFLLVALPWYLMMYKVHGKEFIDVFFGFHNVVRFLQPEHKSGDVIYYYIPVVMVGFLPWSVFLPIGIWQAIREKVLKIKKINLFLALWVLVTLIFFTISRTKLPTYVFPIFPAIAIFIAKFWDSFLNKELSKKQEVFTKVSFYLFFIAIISGIIGLDVLTRLKYPTVANLSLLAGSIFAIFLMVSAVTFLKKQYLKSLIIAMVSFVIFIVPMSYMILPEIGRYVSSKEISGELLRRSKPDDIIAVETRYIRGVAFYTGRLDIPNAHEHHTITKLLAGKKRVWGVMSDKNHSQLYTNEKVQFPYPTYVVYELGKKVIITNKIPEDGKFLKVRSKNEPY